MRLSRSGRVTNKPVRSDMVATPLKRLSKPPQKKRTTRSTNSDSEEVKSPKRRRRRRTLPKPIVKESSGSETESSCEESPAKQSPAKPLPSSQTPDAKATKRSSTRRSILDVADELEALEASQGTQPQNQSPPMLEASQSSNKTGRVLKPQEELEFTDTQVEAIRNMDKDACMNLLTKGHLEYLLYINEQNLRVAQVKTFRGKKKDYYIELIFKHLDIIKGSLSGLKMVSKKTHQPLKLKKPSKDYSKVDFGQLTLNTGIKVVLLMYSSAKLLKFGEGIVSAICPNFIDYPDLDMVDYCVVEITLIESTFIGYMLPYEQEPVEIGESYPWRVCHVVEDENFRSKTKEEFDTVNEFLSSQPTAVAKRKSLILLPPPKQAPIIQDQHVVMTNDAEDHQLLIETLKFRVKVLEKEVSDLKHDQEDLLVMKQEYLRITEILPSVQAGCVDLMKLMLKISGRERTKDVQVMHPIKFASINLMVTDKEWHGLSRNQSVVVMIQWLKLLAPSLKLDLDGRAYCLPKTNNANSAGKTVLDHETVKIIAEGARKYLPFYKQHCRKDKEVNNYIGRALSQIHRFSKGATKESCEDESDWESDGYYDLE